jgi:hypothetical protein
MPVVRHDLEKLEPGNFYVNIRTGKLVEVMDVDLSGNCRVLDAEAELDAPWQQLTYEQISSCLWQLVGGEDDEELPRAA